MEHKWLRKITALLLTLALSVQLASPAFAAVVREENGNFSTIEDIMKVSGIGEGRFAAIEEYIYVEG